MLMPEELYHAFSDPGSPPDSEEQRRANRGEGPYRRKSADRTSPRGWSTLNPVSWRRASTIRQTRWGTP
eukprot:11209630-Lingulodinium_polyedra.AAC.1